MQNKHDFFQFMASVEANIENDYKIVRRRSKEDPGTAGDQVEEQWADILRKWLPATYHVVTRRRILFDDQSSSPQVDILVLKPSYPTALRSQKYVFSGGVLAAFECKLTLRSRDISHAFQTCAEIKRKFGHVLGTPQDELCGLPIFGILAYSHDIRAKDGESRLYENIERAQIKFPDRVSELVDTICVAEEAVLLLGLDLLIGPNLDKIQRQELKDVKLKEAIVVSHVIHGNERGPGDILAAFVHDLTRRLALHDPSIRDWADHLTHLGSYVGIGRPAYIATDELSKNVVDRLRKVGCDNYRWSKWAATFP